MNNKIYLLAHSLINEGLISLFMMKSRRLLLLVFKLIGGNSYAQRDKDTQKSVQEATRAYKEKDYHAAILHASDALRGDLNRKGLKDANEDFKAVPQLQISSFFILVSPE